MLRTIPGRALLALVIALGVVAGVTFAVNLEFDRRVDSIPRVEVAGLSEPTGSAQNFLLVGSDSRAFVGDDPTAKEIFGDESDAGGNRSDTLMLVHADPQAGTGFVVSFPRDLWVQIPGQGGSKINVAHNDGPSKVVETFTSNFNVPINHYLEVDFSAFAGLVDAVGGVNLYFPAPARDEWTGLDVPAGCVSLGGLQALAFVRSRHYQELIDGEWQEDATADIGRIERQQALMRRLAASVIDSAISNPTRAPKIADRAAARLSADRALQPDDMRSLLDAFRGLDPEDPASLEMTTIPWETGPSQGGQSVLYVNDVEAEALFTRLRDPGSAPAADSVDPATVRVQVLNGTGTDGLAGKTLDSLTAAGFVPVGKGDAGTSVDATEIRYRVGQASAAAAVRAALGVGRLVESGDVTDADVVVVLGPDAPVGAPTAAPNTPGRAAPATEPATAAAGPVC